MIASNAGHEGAVVLGKVKEAKDPNLGFDAATEEYTDMIAAGILDPAKVARTALHNAASISALMLTTEALVSEIPEEEKAPAGPPGGAPPMYYAIEIRCQTGEYPIFEVQNRVFTRLTPNFQTLKYNLRMDVA